jgi:glycosyltransferase involved in cell wall biosynthesis
VFPALHNLSHDSDLPTKYYEYAQARLPMVVSDVKTSAETTQRLGNGEVFAAGDADDLVRAVKAVLADLPRYRASYLEYSRVKATSVSVRLRIFLFEFKIPNRPQVPRGESQWS